MDFSNTTTRNGIIQKITRMTSTQATTTSSYSLLDMTVDVNLSLNNYFILAISSEGRWQVDDTNQTDYPIIYGDIVAGVQDYTFLNDENGNQILDIYKINMQDNNGNWTTLTQRDILDQNDRNKEDLTITGIPSEYDLTANGIFLTVIPNFTQVKGLELYINRTPTYFLSTDTTKQAGIPNVFHEYLALRPSYFYCLSKGLPIAATYAQLLYGADGQSGMEGAIKKYYSLRNKSEKKGMRAFKENNR